MKQKTGTGKRVMALVLCAAALLGLLASGFAGIAYGAEVDTARTGSAAFKLDQTPDDYDTAANSLRSWLQAHPDDGLDIRLHRVASVDATGKYSLTEAFSGAAGLAGIASVGPDTKASDWESFAKAAMVAIGNRAPEKSGKAGYADLSGGYALSDLALGLYLVEIRDFNAGDDMYSFVPYLIAVPGYAPGGGRLYDVEAGLKPMKSDRTGSLVIRKVLPECRTEYAGSTFVFEILAVKNGETVYNDVQSLVFTEHGIRALRIDGIPAGSSVTVTELYSGSCYEAEVPSRTVQTYADETATAEFRNIYDDDAPRNGASAVNHMTVGKDANGTMGLSWEKRAASPSVVTNGKGG